MKFISTTSSRNADGTTYQPNQHTQCQNFTISPPHLPPHTAGTPPKRSRLASHDIRLIDKELNSLASAENLLNILHHNVLNLVKFRLCTSQLIAGRGGVVCVH